MSKKPISNQTLPVMEHFYSIQGEGAYAGHAAYFIRLGGCDIGCVWCDVKESWPVENHKQYSIQEIVSWLSSLPKQVIVIITGGEPTMHNLVELTSAIKALGLKIHLETSGAYELLGNFDWVTVSPKKFKAPLDSILAQANELKVVVYNSTDFSWAEKYAQIVTPTCSLFLQPEWSRRHKVENEIVAYIKQNPKWNISLQIHKYLGIE